MKDSPISSFQIGGSISEATSIYIRREADDQLFNALRQGEICYVLNSRQIGKSSLLLNVKNRLQTEGCVCCFIDMSRIGSVNVTIEQWYAGITSELWRGFQLGNTADMLEWWRSQGDITPVQKLLTLFQQELLQHYSGQKLIIFFDEVDSVLSLPFPADDFFSIIRACYNQRADDPRLRNISFAFFGVALPSDLISDKRRSPFNIGRAIPLEGFTHTEAQPLAAGLKGVPYNSEELLSAVVSWTRGQPFLTQKICQLIIDHCTTTSHSSAQECVEHLIHSMVIDNWESNDNPEHLRTIRDRMLLDDDYSTINLATYSQLLSSEGEELDIADIDDYSRLYLTGLISVDHGVIRPRTKVYREVFDETWLQAQLDARRPYARQLQQWRLDQSEQWLLKDQDLLRATQWSEGKHLPEIDHRFIAASQALAQREVQDWNVRLQTEVEQRLRAEAELQDALTQLRKANRETEHANQAKRDFLARVSREVRTDINSVMGLSHLALQRNSDDIIRDYLQKIHTASQYMSSVVSDMVDVHKLERGELTLRRETFLLDDVLDNLIDIKGPGIIRRGLLFNLHLPDRIVPALTGDALRLQQLLHNLIGNAIEHTKQGSIDLSVEVLEQREHSLTLRFCVTDSGPGISDRPVTGVIDKSSNSVLTPGLGLDLCCELAPLMQGELYIESHPGRGSAISVCPSFDLAQTPEVRKSEPLRIALSADGTMEESLQASLCLLGHSVKLMSLDSLERGAALSDHYDKLFISIEGMLAAKPLSDIVNQYPDLDIHPLLAAGTPPPLWLSEISTKSLIQHPSSLRRIQFTLSNLHGLTQEVRSFERFDQRYQILIAEDDEINQQIVRELLEQQGLEVTMVGNGKAVMEALRSHRYNLLLMDIEMPVMGGIEAFNELRELSRTEAYAHLRTLPVIAMTAHALDSDRERFLAAGMDDHLSKPLSPTELRKLLKRWLPLRAGDFIPTVSEGSIDDIDIEGLEVSAGLERCNGNVPLYLRLLKQFAAKYQAESSMQGMDLVELTQYCHGIKGSAVNLGLSRLASAAAEIEAIARGQAQPDSRLLENFRSMLGQCCKQLQCLPSTEPLSEDSRAAALSDSQIRGSANSSPAVSIPRLLLVDTELQLRKALIDILKQDYSVAVASTPEKALELAKGVHKFNVALIKVSLNSDVDGIDLCRRISRLPDSKDTCIFLISHTASEEEYQQGLAAGASDFLPQPISPTLLSARLSKCVG